VKHILLLNPPGRARYLREYFCGKVSKAGYLVHPVDLLWLSGPLARRFRVSLLDAIALRLSPARALARIGDLRPDAAVLLTASVSRAEDLEFARALRPLVPGELVAIGDNFLAEPEAALAANPALDAVLLGFDDPALPAYLDGEGPAALRGIVRRDGDAIVPAEAERPRGEVSIGVPRHDLLDLARYEFPFARRAPYGTVLTDYGCPFRCSFCLIGRLAYRTRPLPEVFEEIALLTRLGVRDLYLDDQTFMPSPERLERFCDGLAGADARMGWTAFVRADLAGDDRLARMKAAGCHTVIVGIESGSDDVLAAYAKDVTLAQIREAIARARRHGLTTVGTFLVGLPGETPATCAATIDLALTSGLDYASFNTPIPRAYTPMRDLVRGQGWEAAGGTLDQSGSGPPVATPRLSAAEAKHYRDLAERRFYLRPGYLARRLASVRTLHQASLLLREGVRLTLRIVARRLGR
jgi:radical SAM superfamily enzyme YgiQ (UPF0313 family)